MRMDWDDVLGTDWFAEWERVEPLLQVEHVYGGVDLRPYGDRLRGPCPLHGGDNESALSVDPNTLTWYCFTKCQRGGGPLQFMFGGESPRGDDFASIVDELSRRVGDSNHKRACVTPLRQGTGYPPTLPATQPVVGCEHSARWLVERMGAGAAEMADSLGVCVALMPSADNPAWCGDWFKRGHLLVTGLYDASGILRSMHGRAVMGDGRMKGAMPKGYSVDGLVMANPTARRMLAYEPERVPRVIVCEGLPDFVTAAIRWPEHAVFGVFSGGWSPELGGRVPKGTRVTLFRHPDEAGKKMMRAIKQTLGTELVTERSWGGPCEPGRP